MPLVVAGAHGGAKETSRAKAVLGSANASRVDVFTHAHPVPAEIDVALTAH